MSIIDPATFDDPEPGWPDEFETPEEWSEYVREHFFGDLEPGAPFLLVVRTLQHDSGRGRTRPTTWLKIEYYVGILTHEPPLVTRALSGHMLNDLDLVLATERFVCRPIIYHDGKRTDFVAGPLTLRHYGFHYTPVTKPFVPPFSLGRIRAHGQETEAFSVACGIEAMEALARTETEEWDKDFAGWYVWTVRRLGLEVRSDDMLSALLDEKRKLIRGLHGCYDKVRSLGAHIERIHGSVGKPEIVDGALQIVTDDAFARIMSYNDRKALAETKKRIANLIATAEELGMAKDYELLDVDGFRYQPAVIVEDYRRLYAIE